MPAPIASHSDQGSIEHDISMAGKRKREAHDGEDQHNTPQSNGADKQMHELRIWMKSAVEILRRYWVALMFPL